MLYWFILGGLFVCGSAYVMLNGAKRVREDNEIQKRKAIHWTSHNNQRG